MLPWVQHRTRSAFSENSMRCALGGTTARIGLLAMRSALLAAAGLLPAAIGHAAPKDKPGDAEPRNEILRTEDGVSLHITYFKSNEEKEAPVIVLLHMKDGNRFVWQGKPDGFALKLQANGYAVITVDLRHHGESKIGGAVGVGNANQGGS